MTKLFLLVAGVLLFPVALSYGVDPAATLPKFMNITVEGTDLTHIFRALMGLYLGMVTFCIIAAFTPEWRHVAVIWAVFFAYSLAIGRMVARVLEYDKDPRKVVTDPDARYSGAKLSENSLIPGKDAKLGSTKFDWWLQNVAPRPKK
jgi:Domain of unknown function (DUF4345)